jgi:acyl-CoA synthetase (AMP-forming)/AMP-acid ligase II
VSDGGSRLAIPDLLAARAEHAPNQVALIVADVGELSFGEWDRRANAVANALDRKSVV